MSAKLAVNDLLIRGRNAGLKGPYYAPAGMKSKAKTRLTKSARSALRSASHLGPLAAEVTEPVVTAADLAAYVPTWELDLSSDPECDILPFSDCYEFLPDWAQYMEIGVVFSLRGRSLGHGPDADEVEIEI